MERDNKGLTTLLVVIIIVLVVLCVLLATDTISFKIWNNDIVGTIDITNHTDDEEILGTYYLNEDNTYYFTLKADGTADVVEASCSTGPLPKKNVPYRIATYENAIILEFDYNLEGDYLFKYTGNSIFKRFYVTTPSCFGEDSYYAKK